MSVSIPIAGLTVAGVVLVIAGASQGSTFPVLFGILTILFAWILDELTKRRSSKGPG